MQAAVVNEHFVEQGAGSKTLRRYASVCWCGCGCARIYILIRNCLCVYFMHQLVIHFIDVCVCVFVYVCELRADLLEGSPVYGSISLLLYVCLHISKRRGIHVYVWDPPAAGYAAQMVLTRSPRPCPHMSSSPVLFCVVLCFISAQFHLCVSFMH